MTSLSTRNLTKMFGSFAAVDDVSVDIPDGKFVCLLGPSGCGKTTLLRLIAGLEDVSSGSLIVDGENQENIPAHKRDFGMVFQSLALFPHLSVAENIAYPLRIRGANAEERRAKATELLDLVQLPNVEDRRIDQLSGGQRQRVAIARGLAIDPKLFLLDEPLSALDAKLREHMQRELRQLQQKLGVTTIVVTHDQREAMTMADIVIIMNHGKVLQIGPPIEIYRNPADSFVANFIGLSNLLPCSRDGDGSLTFFGKRFDASAVGRCDLSPGSNGILSVRPEDVEILSAPGAGDMDASVSFIRDLGASIEISATVQQTEILSVCTPANRPDVDVGQSVSISIHADRATALTS